MFSSSSKAGCQYAAQLMSMPPPPKQQVAAAAQPTMMLSTHCEGFQEPSVPDSVSDSMQMLPPAVTCTSESSSFSAASLCERKGPEPVLTYAAYMASVPAHPRGHHSAAADMTFGWLARDYTSQTCADAGSQQQGHETQAPCSLGSLPALSSVAFKPNPLQVAQPHLTKNG